MHIMGIHTSNAAIAYDMHAAYAPGSPVAAPRAPQTGERPHFDVYTGAGRETNQIVSPMFTHVVKVFCVLVALVFTIGVARVTIASATAAALNASATTTLGSFAVRCVTAKIPTPTTATAAAATAAIGNFDFFFGSAAGTPAVFSPVVCSGAIFFCSSSIIISSLCLFLILLHILSEIGGSAPGHPALSEVLSGFLPSAHTSRYRTTTLPSHER